jgi:hypothetical protein
LFLRIFCNRPAFTHPVIFRAHSELSNPGTICTQIAFHGYRAIFVPEFEKTYTANSQHTKSFASLELAGTGIFWLTPLRHVYARSNRRPSICENPHILFFQCLIDTQNLASQVQLLSQFNEDTSNPM